MDKVGETHTVWRVYPLGVVGRRLYKDRERAERDALRESLLLPEMCFIELDEKDLEEITLQGFTWEY